MRADKETVKYIPDEIVASKICVFQGQKVMLDFDLAALYGVTTKALNQAVKRNADRFPAEFVFRLSLKEWHLMRSQIVTASAQEHDIQQDTLHKKSKSQKKRNAHVTPQGFTEHGVAMLANVLKSERAVQMSLVIVRTFIQLRKQLFDYSELTEELKTLKQHVGDHDERLNQICKAIETLAAQKETETNWQEHRERIGYKQK